MAEQTVKYKVEIDQESLAEQLSAVRQQMDAAMGAASFKEDVLPSAQNYATNAIDVSQIAPPIAQQVQEPAGSSIFQMFDKAAEKTKLGFQKFSEDVRRTGLLVNTDPYLPADEAALHGQGPQGFWRSLGSTILPSAFGGYDRDFSGMFRADFQQEGIKNVTEATDPFKADMLASLSFAAAGYGLGGIQGAIGGFMVGSTVDLVKQLAFAPLVEEESLAKGFEAIAGQNFGNITSDEAKKMANILQDKTNSSLGRKTDYNLDVLQQVQTLFANSGGFANATTAEEMESLVKNTTDQYRRVTAAMKLSMEESVAFMADLQRNMITSGENMADLSERISRIAKETGLSTTGVHNLGMAATNMLRGTGVTQGQSYNMSLDALSQVERIRTGSQFGENLIHQMGGIENAAIAQVESANRFMMSGQGMLLSAAYLGGNNLGGNMGDMLTAAGSYIGADPKRLLALTANQGQLVGEMGFNNAQASMVMSAMQKLEHTNYTNEDGTINVDVLAGFMAQEQGGSPETYKAAIAGFLDFSKRAVDADYNAEIMRKSEAIKLDNQVGFWSRITGEIGDALDSSDYRKRHFRGMYEGVQEFRENFSEGWTEFTTDQQIIDRQKLTSDQRKILDTYREDAGFKEKVGEYKEKAEKLVKGDGLDEANLQTARELVVKNLGGRAKTSDGIVRRYDSFASKIYSINEAFGETEAKDYVDILMKENLIDSPEAVGDIANAFANIEKIRQTTDAAAIADYTMTTLKRNDLESTSMPMMELLNKAGWKANPKNEQEQQNNNNVMASIMQRTEADPVKGSVGEKLMNFASRTNSVSNAENLAVALAENELGSESAQKKTREAYKAEFKKQMLKTLESNSDKLEKGGGSAYYKKIINDEKGLDALVEASLTGEGVKEFTNDYIWNDFFAPNKWVEEQNWIGRAATNLGLNLSPGVHRGDEMLEMFGKTDDVTGKRKLASLKKEMDASIAIGAAKTIRTQAAELAAEDTQSPLGYTAKQEYYDSLIRSNNIDGKDTKVLIKNAFADDVIEDAFAAAGLSKDKYKEFAKNYEKESTDEMSFALNVKKYAGKLEGSQGEALMESLQKAGVGSAFLNPVKHISQQTIFSRLENAMGSDHIKVRIINPKDIKP